LRLVKGLLLADSRTVAALLLLADSRTVAALLLLADSRTVAALLRLSRPATAGESASRCLLVWVCSLACASLRAPCSAQQQRVE
jgi:hypothetical protein